MKQQYKVVKEIKKIREYVTGTRANIVFLLAFAVILSYGSNITVAAEKPIHIYADIFELDGRENFVVASGNVKVMQENISMTGNRVTYNQKNQFAHIVGDVKVTRDDMVLTCNEVKAYGREDRIEAIGDVKFAYNTYEGKAEAVEYKMGPQTVTLTGDPMAWQGQDKVSGNTIHINLKEGKIVTEGSAKITISPERLN